MARINRVKAEIAAFKIKLLFTRGPGTFPLLQPRCRHSATQRRLSLLCTGSCKQRHSGYGCVTTGVGNTVPVGMAELFWVKNRVYSNLNFTASLCRSWGGEGTSVHAEISADTSLCRPARLKQDHVHVGVHPLQPDVNIFVLHTSITTTEVLLGPCRHIWLVQGSGGESVCSGPPA